LHFFHQKKGKEINKERKQASKQARKKKKEKNKEKKKRKEKKACMNISLLIVSLKQTLLENPILEICCSKCPKKKTGEFFPS
jgi:hypothetical protein